MQDTLLIGITGKARAGKDTCADLISGMRRSARSSFAQPIYSAIYSIFGDFTEEQKKDTVPGFDFTYRKALQTLGTEWGRSLDKNIWIKLIQRNYELASKAGITCFLVTDVRFDNEADWVRSQGGIVLEVRKLHCEEVEEHSSEAGLTERADFVVHNNGTLRELETKLLEVLHYAVED